VQKEHSASWKSWGKTRLRKGHRLDTAVGASGQAAGLLGTVSGGVAAGGIAVPSAFVGVTAAAAAGAATLYALPVLVTAGAIAYWGYNKNEHHKVNAEIWKWWCDNCKDKVRDPNKTASLEEAKLWLGWFGDEGISNMNQLSDKLKEAKDAFDNKFKSIQTSAADLGKKISAARQLKEPQRNQTLQQRRQDEETLAGKYLELGKDLEYIRYRLERMLMYNQMLEITIRLLIFHTKKDLESLETKTRDAFNTQTNSYSDLWTEITGELPPL